MPPSIRRFNSCPCFPRDIQAWAPLLYGSPFRGRLPCSLSLVTLTNGFLDCQTPRRAKEKIEPAGSQGDARQGSGIRVVQDQHAVRCHGTQSALAGLNWIAVVSE